MSDLESKQTAIRFVPAPDAASPSDQLRTEDAAARSPSRAQRPPTLPGNYHLVFGVMLPAVVIAIEAVWRLCAETFFDPMPTLWHGLVVAFVPAVNLVWWLVLQKPERLHEWSDRRLRWLAFANGAAAAIGSFYALIFVPLLPFALLAIVYFGAGLLPMGPLFSLLTAARLRQLANLHHGAPLVRSAFAGGIVGGLALLVTLDVPAAATRLGVHWATSPEANQRQRGLTLLRTLGDEELLRRLSYDAVGRPAGLMSALVMFGTGAFDSRRQLTAASPAAVREVYYRVYGMPFNARPAPFVRGRWQGAADFAFDADHGGAQVGGRVQGLSIVASRLDGSVAADDAVAYLEWTVEFRNVSQLDREARLQLALPPGGVVSRATLWVNGEEREAAYGGRAQVRAAYERVAVQQRRDPLLVTTKGADRVLAQAFPVPRNGGTIKFKLGITAPLELTAFDKGRLVLPALLDRNFSIGADFHHHVWIEAKQPLSSATAGLTAEQAGIDRYRLTGELTDPGLARLRPVLLTERRARAGAVLARLGEGPHVLQEIASVKRARPSALLLVVDGSARMKAHAPQIVTALEALPAGTRVGLLIAGDTVQRVVPADLTPAHKQAMTRLLREASFVGGQDNSPALIEALRLLEPEPSGTLLWVHGPQPMRFAPSSAAFEQALARLGRLPQTLLYSIEPGPNEVLPDAPWGWGARLVPRTASTSADLAEVLAQTFSAAPVLVAERKPAAADANAATGSDHIARLWARSQVLDLMRADATVNRPAALALAVNHRLITPVSGAVVLETQQQYQESGLTPVDQATVPTVPEPHEWALLLMGLAGLAWLVRRQRAAGAARSDERLGAAA